MLDKCQKCSRRVTADEAALCKKLIGKNLTKYMCITCMAKYFEVSEKLLNEKIEQYKALGCTLFE